jgi:hypothetical protein
VEHKKPDNLLTEWWPVLAVFILCIVRMFWPQLQANSGLGWDGYRYYLLTVDGINSNILDSYYIMRFFPSLLVHTIFKICSIEFTPANVILGFKVMHTILLTLAAVMAKGIFTHFKLRPISQVIGFVLLFFNYGALNFTYFYPVMTDTPAFFLSVAAFYFFVRGELLNLALIALIGAFTWPVITVMAIALLIFPNYPVEYKPLPTKFKLGLGFVAAAYALAMGWYLIIGNGEKADLQFVLPLKEDFLPVSFFYVALLFLFMPWLLNNKTFLSIDYIKTAFNPNRIFAIVMVMVLFLVLRGSISFNQSSEYVTLYHQVKIHLVYAFVRPLITIFSHFNYWGVIMVLVIIFWGRFSAFVTTFGLGMAGVLFLNVAFFGMKPESRALVHFFPWLMILMALFLDKFEFHKSFYAFIILVNAIMGKLWLVFNDNDAAINPDGTIGGPAQWFYMHLGIWMTEKVWMALCVATILTIIAFTLILYRIKWDKGLAFYARFKPVE